MINIIKSVNYSTKRDTVAILTILTIITIPVIFVISLVNNGTKFSDITPSVYYGNQTFAELHILYVIATLILTCKAVGGDASDKTINYELLSGHGRTRSFIARLITGFLWGTVIVMICEFLPLIYLGLINGWGLETDMKNVIIRCFILIFPYIRTTAFFMMVACVLRGSGKGIAVGYISVMIDLIVWGILNGMEVKWSRYIGGMVDGQMLLTPENYRDRIIDGVRVKVLDTAVEGKTAAVTIIISLVLAVIYITIAYQNYKKSDRD